MTAHDQMRSMLDQLMGTARDGETSRDRIQFDDDRVCKSFLLNCCPHDILASTRMDLGECSKVHDMALRADFESASKRRDYYYDIDAMEHLDGFIKDCDRKTEMAKRRLKETQEELSEEANAKADTIHALGEQIGTKLAKAEELGADGNVEESLTMMAEVETLNQEKSKAENDFRNSMPASRYQQQKLRVCEVCCAFLGIHDNDRQLADHFGGKLHLGFIAIRDKLENLKKSVQDRKEKRDRERDERHRERSRSGSRSRRRPRSGSRSRRSRSGSRHRRSRSREYRRRSRDRRRRRSRSRSRSRSSRKRTHRSRSRSGSRSHKSKRHDRRRGSPGDRSPRAENGRSMGSLEDE